MKTHILLANLSILLIVGEMSAKEIVVEQPAFNVRINNDFEIEKIIINDKSTTLKMKVYGFGLVDVDKDIYLNVDGKEYPLQHSENIEFGKVMNREQAFTLVFPPIPAKTERFDLCNHAKDWMIWDIELKRPKKNSKPSTAHVSAEFIKAANIKDDGKGLAAPQWKEENATLKGVFAGYKPEMDFCIEILPDNIITGERKNSYFADVNPDGTFEIAVPMLVSRQVQFYVVSGNKEKLNFEQRMRAGNSFKNNIFFDYTVLSPGEETRICFDLPAYFRKQGQLRYDKQTAPKIFYFAGANAEINNQYFDADYNSYSSKINNSVRNPMNAPEIGKMSPSEYKELVLNTKSQCIAGINAHPSLTLKMKEFFSFNLAYLAANCLDDISITMQSAKMMNMPGDTLKDPVTGQMKITKTFTNGGLEPIELDKKYYSYLNDLPLNNPVSLYFRYYWDKVNRGRFISSTINDKSTSVADIIGTSEGLFFDLMKCHDICSPFDLKPLKEESIEQLEQMKSPFYEQIILARNEEILAKIEYNKSRQDYHAHDVQGKDDDELFEAIIGKEKGKVVLVDFWATWCIPCFANMNEFKPYKKNMDPDKVVFVYLTDETSPVDTWNLVIPEFSGEHYRLNRKQYDYMKQRLGVTENTIPQYVLLDKNNDNISLQPEFRSRVVLILDKINDAMEK